MSLSRIEQIERERATTINRQRAAVLVVDDEPALLELFEAVLADAFNIYLASSAESALQILATRHVDCVISDYTMPGMNGGELIRAINQHYPRVRTILHSASAPEEDAIPCDLRVPKPTSLEEIAELVSQLLQRAA